MEQTNRISLDLDDNSVTEVKVYRSASGKGAHIEISLTKPLSYYQSFLQRLYCGDDIRRLNASMRDLERGFNPDILYTHKKYGSKWKKRHLLGTFKPNEKTYKAKRRNPCICFSTNVNHAEDISCQRELRPTSKHTGENYKEKAQKNFTKSLTHKKSHKTPLCLNQYSADQNNSKSLTSLTFPQKLRKLKKLLRQWKRQLRSKSKATPRHHRRRSSL